MIRKLEKNDLDEVMRIWLESNIKAHDFIDENYWKENFANVKEMLPKATVFVYEENGKTQGFVGLMGNYIAGIFVDEKQQSRGIGKQLLEYIKTKHASLSLKVYKKNIRAVSFYQREKFTLKGKQIDENTGEIEYLMEFEN